MKNSCPNDLTKKLLERCKKVGYNKVVIGRPTPTEYSGYFALPSISAYYDENEKWFYWPGPYTDGPQSIRMGESVLFNVDYPEGKSHTGVNCSPALFKMREEFNFQESCAHGGNPHVVQIGMEDLAKLTIGEWNLEEVK